MKNDRNQAPKDLSVLRDDFAMSALAIVAEQYKREGDAGEIFLSPDGYASAARAAYKLADAMIEARGERP